jgi:hypothetical protein
VRRTVQERYDHLQYYENAVVLGASYGTVFGLPIGPSHLSTQVLTAMNFLIRELKIGDGGAVTVRIFWPVEDTSAWDCRWEIAWPERSRSNSGRGVDAIQALLHALQMVGAELYESKSNGAGLVWQDNWKGYGFPVPANMRNSLVGDDAKFL